VNPKYVFWGLVIAAAVLFTVIHAVLGNVLLAALSFVLGVLWLVADAKIEDYLGTLFFLMFIGVAVITSLFDSVIPLAVLGMSANLAAWDLSRFRARLAGANVLEIGARLEARHLRLLAVIIVVGIVIALLPLVIRLPLPFVIVFLVALLTLLMLYQSMRFLSTDQE
jgi:hypothetical protein